MGFELLGWREASLSPLRTGHERFPSSSSLLTVRVAIPRPGISLNLKLGTFRPWPLSSEFVPIREIRVNPAPRLPPIESSVTLEKSGLKRDGPVFFSSAPVKVAGDERTFNRCMG